MLFLPPEGGNRAVQNLDRPPLGHNRDSTSVLANRNTCRPAGAATPRDLADRDSTSLRSVSM